jgi:hypothetical protein
MQDVVGRVACRTSRSLPSGQLGVRAGDDRRTVEQSLPQSPHFHGRQLTSTHILLGLLAVRNHPTRILDRCRKLGDTTIGEKLYHVCECCISDFLVYRKGSAGSHERDCGRTGMRELFSEGEDGTGGKLVLSLGLWFCASDGGDGRHGDDQKETSTGQLHMNFELVQNIFPSETGYSLPRCRYFPPASQSRGTIFTLIQRGLYQHPHPRLPFTFSSSSSPP